PHARLFSEDAGHTGRSKYEPVSYEKSMVAQAALTACAVCRVHWHEGCGSHLTPSATALSSHPLSRPVGRQMEVVMPLEYTLIIYDTKAPNTPCATFSSVSPFQNIAVGDTIQGSFTTQTAAAERLRVVAIEHVLSEAGGV